MPLTPISVLIADDNFVVRAGLTAHLQLHSSITVLEATDGAEAVKITEEAAPDIALLDVRMPVLDGVSALDALVERTKVIMLTHSDDPDTVRTCLRKGALGYLVYGAFTPSELAGALHDVASGEGTPLSPPAVQALMDHVRSTAAPPEASAAFGLTRRESQIMRLVTAGLTNGMIAEELTISEKTVKNHVNHMYAKLHVRSRAEAIARWMGTDKGEYWANPLRRT